MTRTIIVRKPDGTVYRIVPVKKVAAVPRGAPLKKVASTGKPDATRLMRRGQWQ